jgi:hypothetical protein
VLLGVYSTEELAEDASGHKRIDLYDQAIIAEVELDAGPAEAEVIEVVG